MSANIPEDYVVPDVWEWVPSQEGRFAAINRPIAGATHDQDLPAGRHPLQLYSLATPNGVKVTVLLEELLALGISGAEYDAWLVSIMNGEQFSSGFVAANPNSKIPAMIDHSGAKPVRIFESGAILVYLAEKFGHFLPADLAERAEVLSWVFWQVGSAPYLGGGFGHFYAYSPTRIEYCIDRFTMEVKRQLDVLDRRLGESRYLAGEKYTIADMAVWPWYGAALHDNVYGARRFLDFDSYANLARWREEIGDRPAVRRGQRVNRTSGPEELQMPERHDAADFGP